MNVLVKVQNAWPDRYYQLPVDDFYTDYFAWSEDENGKYSIEQGWTEDEDSRIVYSVYVNERGQNTLTASFFDKSIRHSYNKHTDETAF